MDDAAARAERTGAVLVALQFVLIALLAAAGLPAFVGGRAPLGAWALAAASAALGAAALRANRPGNFNIRPTPREGGRLVQDGPYRWIRHPMYTSVIGFALAAAWSAGRAWPWAAAGALFGVLWVKAGMEERWMAERHAAYAAYRARTRRFLPFVL